MALLDILNPELTEEQRRVIVSSEFHTFHGLPISTSIPRSVTPGPAKDLNQFFPLVEHSIRDLEDRTGTTSENRVIFTEEQPDTSADSESIVFSVISREPGAFSKGAPLKGKVKNQNFIPRESRDDPDNPGYKLATIGYLYDNVARFTCWARTNKAANSRVFWFENMMEEYKWWFRLQGINRMLFLGRRTDIVTTVSNNKWYGRPVDFYVRTEKLQVFSEKEFEQMILRVEPTA